MTEIKLCLCLNFVEANLTISLLLRHHQDVILKAHEAMKKYKLNVNQVDANYIGKEHWF